MRPEPALISLVNSAIRRPRTFSQKLFARRTRICGSWKRTCRARSIAEEEPPRVRSLKNYGRKRRKPLRPISLGPRALEVECKVSAGYEGNLAPARAVRQDSCCS